MDGARQGKKKDFFPLAEERSSKGISLSWEKKKNVGLIEGIRLKTKRRDQGEGVTPLVRSKVELKGFIN